LQVIRQIFFPPFRPIFIPPPRARHPPSAIGHPIGHRRRRRIILNIATAPPLLPHPALPPSPSPLQIATMNNSQAQQFAALQKATATYNNDAKMADHLRRREVDMMTRAAEQNRQYEEELRIAHGELGEEARKQKNLIMERNRCKQATETDRQFIFTITSELKGIEVRTTIFDFSSCWVFKYSRFQPHQYLHSQPCFVMAC
jgi:hypothetical protein